MSVKFYSSHCRNCMTLQALMNSKGIAYEIIDDEEVYLPIADAHQILSMPFAEVNGVIFNTKQLQDWIDGQ